MPHGRPLMRLAIAFGILAVCAGGPHAQAPLSSPLPLPNPYRVDEAFKLEMPRGLTTLGAVSAVKVGPDNSLYVFHRCVANSCTGRDDINPVLVYNQQGKLLRQMGAGLFVWPHGMQVMPDMSFWTTDAASPQGGAPTPGRGHQVFHHDSSGRVVLSIGKAGMPGAGHDTLHAPSDVVIGRNGDIFVADGHGGATGKRIVKFNSKGEYITEWGGRGSGPGQIEAPHALAMDSQGRLFLGDRSNNRIQVFTQDGTLVAEWKQFGRPSGIAIDRNDVIYVTDTQTTKGRPGFENGIYIGSARDGKVTGFIPRIRPRSTWEAEETTAGGNAAGEATNMEAIGVTPDGSTLYGGEVGLMTVIRFVKK